jgi:phosphatidylglycerol:prolipoprotein diacylglycerol transferase
MIPSINLGPLSLPAPALILLAGFWLGIWLTQYKSRVLDIEAAFVDRLIWSCLAAGLIGARLSFLIRYPAAFQGDFISIFLLKPAMLDLPSGILLAAAVALFLVSRSSISLLRLLDGLTPFLGTMAAAVHFSHFASGSFFGVPTNLPWAIYLWNDFRHPVQLYFLAASLVILAYVSFTRVINPQGRLFLSFLALTSGYMLFLSKYQVASNVFWHLRTDQIAYWLLLLFSLVWLNTTSQISQESTHGLEI